MPLKLNTILSNGFVPNCQKNSMVNEMESINENKATKKASCLNNKTISFLYSNTDKFMNIKKVLTNRAKQTRASVGLIA